MRVSRLVVYLATVAGAYLVLGLGLVGGMSAVEPWLQDALDTTAVRVGQLGLGAVLLVAGAVSEPWTPRGKARKAERRRAREAERGPGRVRRWRQQATAGGTPHTVLMGLALGAVAVEAASMVPYLGATGLLTASSLTFGGAALVLVAYCLVMVAPAMLLLLARVTLHDHVAPALERLEAWMTHNMGELTAWVLALVGFLLAADAARALDLV